MQSQLVSCYAEVYFLLIRFQIGVLRGPAHFAKKATPRKNSCSGFNLLQALTISSFFVAAVHNILSQVKGTSRNFSREGGKFHFDVSDTSLRMSLVDTDGKGNKGKDCSLAPVTKMVLWRESRK